MADMLQVERHDAIALVRLRRPEVHHALNTQLCSELMEALLRLREDEDVRVLILTGSGDRAFCAGRDMAEATSGEPPRGPGPEHVVAELGRYPKPVIAAINGYCYGAGAVLAVLSDIRLAAERATFRFPGAAYGLVVGAARLPSLVGPAKAKELIYTARVFDAAEALAIGLVNHVYPNEALLNESLAMARQIAANSAEALKLSKAVIDTATLSGPAEQGEFAANKKLRASVEHRQRFKVAADTVTGRGGRPSGSRTKADILKETRSGD